MSFAITVEYTVKYVYVDALIIKIAKAEETCRDLETQAANSDAVVLDLMAVNPDVVAQPDNRRLRKASMHRAPS